MEKWDDAYRMYRGGLIRRWCENSNENCHDNSSASSARTIVGNCTRKALIRPLENNRVHFFKNPINSNVDIFMYIIPDIFLAINKIFLHDFHSPKLMKKFPDNSLRICIVHFNPSMHLYEVKRFKKRNVDRNWSKIGGKILGSNLGFETIKIGPEAAATIKIVPT